MEASSLKWWVLLTVIVGTFLGRLDQSIVNLALPSIIDDFGISIAAAGWIATAYIIANAVFVPVWGKLGDILGRKKIYIFGFSIFIFGSLLAGLAWNLSSMIVFRVIQAIASSADYPTAMAIIAVTFKEGKERAQALGIWSASFAAAVVFGPLIGGPLIDIFGWRSIFLINLPIGILGIVMALTFVRESRENIGNIKFDWWGAINLGIVLASLVFVLEKGSDWGWISGKSLITYAVILVFSFIFYLIEKDHPDPIVDFKFFRNVIFVGALANNFMIFMGMMGGVFLIPIFVQTFLGYDATQTGYLFIPMAFLMMIGAQIGGRMVGKIKASVVIGASTIVASVGLFLFSVFLDPRSNAFDIIIPLSIMAFGMGFGMAQRTNAIAAAVPQKEIGIASSILALARNIAGAFGIAVFATFLNSFINNNIIQTARNTIINSVNPAVIKQAAALVILKSQVNAYANIFIISAVLVFIAGVAAFFIRFEVTKDMKVRVEA
jgi:EmrB/QacA subfamily drug resistance transporter